MKQVRRLTLVCDAEDCKNSVTHTSTEWNWGRWCLIKNPLPVVTEWWYCAIHERYAERFNKLESAIKEIDPHLGVYDRQKLVDGLVKRGVDL